MPENISKRFARSLKDEFEGAIQDEIMSGKSPVRGHKWPDYSDAYAKRKGFKRPNMFLTGKMLKSLRVVQDPSGRVIVSFSDEKASWHQTGAGNLPKRKLLPRGRDRFNVKLTKLIQRILKEAVKKSIDSR